MTFGMKRSKQNISNTSFYNVLIEKTKIKFNQK